MHVQLWRDWDQPELVELTDLDVAYDLLLGRGSAVTTEEELGAKIQGLEEECRAKVSVYACVYVCMYVHMLNVSTYACFCCVA